MMILTKYDLTEQLVTVGFVVTLRFYRTCILHLILAAITLWSMFVAIFTLESNIANYKLYHVV